MPKRCRRRRCCCPSFILRSTEYFVREYEYIKKPTDDCAAAGLLPNLTCEYTTYYTRLLVHVYNTFLCTFNN